MPRVLITGAAGFIGMHASIRYLYEGWDVIGLDSVNNYYSVGLKNDRINRIKLIASTLNNNFDFYHANLNSNIWNKFREIPIELVIHLAAQAGVRYSLQNPRAYIESNILGFQSVIDFVTEKEIKKLLYASSSSVYGKEEVQPFTESMECSNPESYYAATKRANELMAHAYSKTHGLNSLGLRFFTVYGPWGRPDMAPMLFTSAALKDEEISVFNHGKQRRDFTYIDDVIESIFRLSICFDTVVNIYDKGVINIGKGSPDTLEDFINTIEKHTGSKIRKKYIEAQLGDVEETYADIEKLRKLIDYHPKIGLDEGLFELVKWYRSYY